MSANHNDLVIELVVKGLFVSEKADDIYPYATFVLPEGGVAETSKVRGMPSTMRYKDTLVLHENTTLPLSDANSKSV